MTASANKWWCEFAWLGGDLATRDVLLTIDGDRILDIEPGVRPPASATRLDGLTMPGFANVHSHAFHRALRGRNQRGADSFWSWREQMYALAARLQPDMYFALARAVFAEMALAGVTAVGEFHYLHHDTDGAAYSDANAMGDALIAAAAESGVRLTLLDTCYLRGGFGVDLDTVQRRFADADAHEWAARVDALRSRESATVIVGAAIHSVRAVPVAALTTVAEWAATNARPLHAHVSEQPRENDDCLTNTGRTPTALLDDAGVLSASFCAVHDTHLSADDVARMGHHQAFSCFCPTTERDLADGLGPARALRDAGARLCLGTDSHAHIDMLEEARAVELHERLATRVRGTFAASELLGALTEHGHAAIGWHDAGRLEPGALADFVTVGFGSPRLAGTEPDSVLDSVVFAGSSADVRHVVVGGVPVIVDGRHRSIDVVRELDRVMVPE